MSEIKFKNSYGYEADQADHNRLCRIVSVIADPSDTSLIEAHVMPQFLIRFLDTGDTRTAYPEEIDKEFWTNEMVACLQGIADWHKEDVTAPERLLHAKFWNYGRELGSIKNDYVGSSPYAIDDETLPVDSDEDDDDILDSLFGGYEEEDLLDDLLADLEEDDPFDVEGREVFDLDDSDESGEAHRINVHPEPHKENALTGDEYLEIFQKAFMDVAKDPSSREVLAKTLSDIARNSSGSAPSIATIETPKKKKSFFGRLFDKFFFTS